jgi:putative DNA primase/helicase
MMQMGSALLSIERVEFDTRRELLACLNGVIDLRTSELLPHNPAGFHRRHSPVAFSPGTKDTVFEQFMVDTTAGVPGMAAALQIRAGYFATGYTREEELDFFVGPGGSGKSTLAEALMRALGTLAIAMDAETFLKQDLSSRSHTEDIMQLEGRRLAIVQEPDAGRKLRTGLLKKLTGQDVIRGRGIYEKEREFQNQAKLVFAFNSAPTLPTSDSGMQRRLWVWPFNNAIPLEARDHAVKAHIVESEESQRAVLAWVVAGAREYLALDRFPPPSFVQHTTNQLWQENDIFARFVEECCQVGPDCHVKFTPLWEAFEQWNRQEGGPKVTGKEFRDWLDANGRVSTKSNGVTTRQGIDLLPDLMSVRASSFEDLLG